jgi:hypothetical protein
MLPALLMMIATGMPAGHGRELIDVHAAREPGNWVSVHDTVMGGVSRGGLHQEDCGLVFAGEVSLDNNGGFASVRTRPRDFQLQAAAGLVIRVRGDGRPYRLRLRLDDRFDGVAWNHEFATEAGVWITVEVPFSAFEPMWRGRRLEGRPPLDPAQVRQIGFMIADKQAGPFRLEIARVAAY